MHSAIIDAYISGLPFDGERDKVVWSSKQVPGLMFQEPFTLELQDSK